jgi:hypothetical protein
MWISETESARSGGKKWLLARVEELLIAVYRRETQTNSVATSAISKSGSLLGIYSPHCQRRKMVSVLS